MVTEGRMEKAGRRSYRHIEVRPIAGALGAEIHVPRWGRVLHLDP